ncbi:Glutaredoxin domain-containing protein [Cephalotus follicularis]|uniref:Glutaredoxin domain-containing protein n=1 Tax=Cephalotus follicularis TaxID=3775 RepID=A0A1Q3BFX0_CEPFO|nr:Glutaredoxin domain-containing protein [Cephalotus follicularis]
MGCVSSKLLKKQLNQDIILNNGVEHVVSLTSSTYGALQLDNQQQQQQPTKEFVSETRGVQRSPCREEAEVINTWELMEDLEEGIPISKQPKKSPKSRVLLRGFGDLDSRSPLKFFNQFGSPKRVKRFGGKENKIRDNGIGSGAGRTDFTLKSALKWSNSSENPCKAVLRLSFPVKSGKTEMFDCDSGYSSRRKSFSPLFDPALVASYERELSEEEEQIKMIISATPKPQKSQGSESILQPFQKKCPPGGENAVVIYTTTLRGIRKTFEDCNTVRSITDSHLIHILERDISMDSGFKEELRGLMGTKDVKVPVVFVKGRLIGGVDEVVKLEEEGKLGLLFEGIRSAISLCEGCAGMRFMMCMECNGSCKVLDEEQKKMVRCEECNENGLIQCPICC